jgi:hypothetical protein
VNVQLNECAPPGAPSPQQGSFFGVEWHMLDFQELHLDSDGVANPLYDVARRSTTDEPAASETV